MKKIFLSVLVTTLVFTSCQKDISSEINNPVTGTPKLASSPLKGSVAGVVVNENNLPVANATVTVANSVYTTDSRGMFNTSQLTLDKYITTVKVTTPGYFTGYRSFSANATKNYVSIKLIPKTLAGTFSSSASGNISLANGSSVSFQANSINIKSTGASYTGTVKVYASYIDPTSQDFATTVPGSMMAEDVNNFYVLRSTGMMAVELESDAGIPLQLNNTKPATMKLTIPSTLLSKAPAVIDTWSLDDRGVWIKEAVATKNGNAYEFSVSHFSFWNCDVPVNAIYLSLNLKDQNGHNYINTWVDLTSSTTWGTRGGITDSLGNVSGMVPRDESLQLDLYNGFYYCNTPFYTQNIGPFASNASLNIVAPYTNANAWTVNGTATDCSGAPVQAGTVIVYNGYYQSYTAFSGGTFQVYLGSCNPLTSIDLIVIDNTTNEQSATITVANTGNSFNAGAVSACGTSTNQYINYILDGTSFSITDVNGSLYSSSSPASTFVSGYDQVNNHHISFGFNGASAGTFSVGADSISVNTYTNAVAQPAAAVTVTTFPAIGQYFTGTFDIPFGATGSIHTLTGSFRLRRN